MIGNVSALPDRKLDTKTLISLRREPCCFAFLCPHAVMPVMTIESLHFDIASADYFEGRPSVWATLEMRTSFVDEACTLLGFDESFLRPFSRAIVEAASTRVAHRMVMSRPTGGGGTNARSNRLPRYIAESSFVLPSGQPRLMDYIRGAAAPVQDLVLSPHEDLLLIGTSQPNGSGTVDTLFQLPRTDSFLRAFVRTVFEADRALQETLAGMARIDRLKGGLSLEGPSDATGATS